jgi:hypothetical protein
MLKIRAMSNPRQAEEGENPIVIGGDPNWVRTYFVDPAKEGWKTIKSVVTLDDGRQKTHRRIYLPALVRDNPNRTIRDDYEFRLARMPKHQRKALLEGNWYVTKGSFYDMWDDRMHIRPRFNIPTDWPMFRAMDWGYKLPGIIGWFAMDPDGDLYMVHEHNFRGKTATMVAADVERIEKKLGLWKGKRSLLTGPADTQLWEKRGDATGQSKAEEFALAGVHWVPADKKSRARNAERVAERLGDHYDGQTNPGLMFFDTCRKTTSILPAIQTNPDRQEEPADGGEDHAHDMVCYACSFASVGLAGLPRVGRSKKWDEDDREEENSQEAWGQYGYGLLA